jgi:hypothetical protein
MTDPEQTLEIGDTVQAVVTPTTGPVNSPVKTMQIAKPGMAQTHLNYCMIWVTFQQIGFHRYPNAPEEVAYLRDVHRHVFHFNVGIQVFHDDREIEFHMFMNWLRSLYANGDLELNYKSCEMLAQDVTKSIYAKYDCTKRRIEVTVSEDGECGATLVTSPVHTLY